MLSQPAFSRLPRCHSSPLNGAETYLSTAISALAGHVLTSLSPESESLYAPWHLRSAEICKKKKKVLSLCFLVGKGTVGVEMLDRG